MERLTEQPVDFYKPDVLPAAQPIVLKHYRKTQWFGCLLSQLSQMNKKRFNFDRVKQ